jgi:hypothetical protein
MAAGATDDAALPETPPRDAIAAALTRLKPRVQACYEKERQSGIVNVEVTIARSGRVSAASATGKFAGSATGACVATAVKSASFPRFRAASLKVDYPFMIVAQ